MSVKATDASFEEEVLKSDTPVLVDFWAEWCGPCRMIGPSLEDIAKEMDGKLKVVKVNIDENPMAPTRYGVRSIRLCCCSRMARSPRPRSAPSRSRSW